MGRQEGGFRFLLGGGGEQNPKSHKKEPPKDMLCGQERCPIFKKNSFLRLFVDFYLDPGKTFSGQGGSLRCPAGGGGFGLYPSGGGERYPSPPPMPTYDSAAFPSTLATLRTFSPPQKSSAKKEGGGEDE